MIKAIYFKLRRVEPYSQSNKRYLVVVEDKKKSVPPLLLSLVSPTFCVNICFSDNTSDTDILL